MRAVDVVALYDSIEQQGITIWIDGGWSVDALLGKETRAHQDLDIAVEWKDMERLQALLDRCGYRKVRADGQWNFVYSNDQKLELDVHAFIYDQHGNVVEGIMYPADSLKGVGTIAGRSVRCITAEHMVAFLAPWISKWPEKYVPAVAELCEKFGLELPEEYQRLQRRAS